jgi:hypothetical protein
MVAALVPAEVLALHAVVLSLTSKIGLDQDGNSITTITYPETLRMAFYVLVAFSIVLYLLPRPPMKKISDYLRAAIPPAAFAAWTMLQKPSALDVVWPSLQETPRLVAAILAAVLLGALAKALADKADNTAPTEANR